MDPNFTLSHPKPLAFTETAGASSLRRAVYRSGALWQYCVGMFEAGKTPSADFLYSQYLNDNDIVVIDDATYVDTNEPPAIPELPLAQDQFDLGTFLRANNIMDSLPKGHYLPFPEEDDEDED